MAKQKDLPKRPRREDCFLGIHFDKHMNERCTEVGKNVTRRMVQRIIDLVGPDYIQVDCKGHTGIASYPTKVGHPAPGFVKDQLRIWRQVTAAAGVGLFMHYSGVLDAKVAQVHPEWSARDAGGKRHPRAMSVFGPYVDELLIPQLKELRDAYHVDGIWLDGECWGCDPDYSKWARKAWREKTGQAKPPKPGEEGYDKFLAFCREGFREYLRRYLDALHAHDLDYQIASNWAFSSHMPEPVSAGVDFLSGDYSWVNSVRSARWEGRCLAGQGTPWDLMAWSFVTYFDEKHQSTKTPLQLKQEAAVVLALGGGFQAYFRQKDDASINDWTMDIMAEVAEFCRARQKVCHKAMPVPQIALLYPGKSFYRMTERVFSPWNGETKSTEGILNALVDAQLPVEVAMEHHLDGRMADYPLIVVPEWEWLAPKLRRELVAYVEGGGNLLVIGARAFRGFAKQLDVKRVGQPRRELRYLAHGGFTGGLKTDFQQVKLGRKAKPFAGFHQENDPRFPSWPAASVARCGKGTIAAVYADFGSLYSRRRATVWRDMLHDLCVELMGRPIVEVDGSHRVDVTAMRKDGALMVNLVNTSGPHGDPHVMVFDEVPEVGTLDITIRPGRKPKNVRVVPRGGRVKWSWSRGELKLTLPKLELHEVIVVE